MPHICLFTFFHTAMITVQCDGRARTQHTGTPLEYLGSIYFFSLSLSMYRTRTLDVTGVKIFAGVSCLVFFFEANKKCIVLLRVIFSIWSMWPLRFDSILSEWNENHEWTFQFTTRPLFMAKIIASGPMQIEFAYEAPFANFVSNNFFFARVFFPFTIYFSR